MILRDYQERAQGSELATHREGDSEERPTLQGHWILADKIISKHIREAQEDHEEAPRAVADFWIGVRRWERRQRLKRRRRRASAKRS